jgi:phosphoribosylamine--glycine ligase
MICNKTFGEASSTVVIEEFLKGIEISVFVVSDGKDYHILGSAKDYKRILEEDKGPNTGGMGSVSPVPFADEVFMSKVKSQIIEPSLNGLSAAGHPYKGFMFLGLMNDGGNPKVIEYNVRMGDPETESIFPRLKTDMLDLLNGVANNRLSEIDFSLDERTAVCVFLVSEGYPGSVEKGISMTIGLDTNNNDLFVFHAGTKVLDDHVVTNGGRVIAVTTLANSIEEARENTYKAIEGIKFEGKNYRKDIGNDLIRYISNGN